MCVCGENTDAESKPQICIVPVHDLSQHPWYASELFILPCILLVSIQPERKEQRMCKSILVVSTTSGVLYLGGFLKLILGEWQGFLCVPSQSFYERGNLPDPFSVLNNNKDK